MNHFVYILQSELDGSFYIGSSTHPALRLEQHNRGEAEYTSQKMAWKIVYLEQCESKNAALKRERFLKRQKNRSYEQ